MINVVYQVCNWPLTEERANSMPTCVSHQLSFSSAYDCKSFLQSLLAINLTVYFHSNPLCFLPLPVAWYKVVIYQEYPLAEFPKATTP